MSISDLQIDTSSAATKNSLLSLYSVQNRPPFSELVGFIESAIEPLQLSNYGLDNNAHFLNMLCSSIHKSVPIHFCGQQEFEEDKRYYEQIIFETKQVPTRSNWHDFFNGIIWCQFPKTKHAFNARHIAEMASQGSTKRSPTRDRMTHFDECGIVLFTTHNEVSEQLKNHQWDDLFVKNTAKWHQQTLPVIFGHAIWEMLLAPFIGLTAKATVIEVSNEVMANLQSTLNTSEFYAVCDNMLSDHIERKHLIEMKKPWHPLPLLGILQWSPFEQTQLFYDNKQYFMPKRL
jgi:hypothetical protein